MRSADFNDPSSGGRKLLRAGNGLSDWLTAADGAKSVYATDLDGDGDADVLSASFIDDKIAWYENYTFRRVPGDCDLDGYVDRADLEIVARNWGKDPAEWTDGNFDDNTVVDLSDMIIVAINWDPAPGPGAMDATTAGDAAAAEAGGDASGQAASQPVDAADAAEAAPVELVNIEAERAEATPLGPATIAAERMKPASDEKALGGALSLDVPAMLRAAGLAAIRPSADGLAADDFDGMDDELEPAPPAPSGDDAGAPAGPATTGSAVTSRARSLDDDLIDLLALPELEVGLRI